MWGVPLWLWGVTGAGTAGYVMGSEADMSTDPLVLEAQLELEQAQKQWFENPVLIGLITVPLAAILIIQAVK